MRIVKFWLCLAAIAALAGCAHPIVISPDISTIQSSDTDRHVKQNVGYYIAEDLRTKEVITPGGGGDKVSYQPYRDIETAFYKMLSNVYDGVTKLASPTDSAAISKNNLSYVITPEVSTNSSSPSPFTWPPTQFTVYLTCKISDPAGNVVETKKVSGNGNAEFDEFKRDHGLSAKRAAQDALLKMQHALSDVSELRSDATSPPAAMKPTIPKAASTDQPVSNPASDIQKNTLVAPEAPQPQISQMPIPQPQAVETIAVTDIAQTKVQTPTISEANAIAKAEPVASDAPTMDVKKVGFQLGISSHTVERLAKQQGCESKDGAGLITSTGPVEVYRMSCLNGTVYLAKCELRQCVPMHSY